MTAKRDPRRIATYADGRLDTKSAARVLQRAARLGFDSLLLPDVDAAELKSWLRPAGTHGVSLLVSVDLARMWSDADIVTAHPEWFRAESSDAPDPRVSRKDISVDTATTLFARHGAGDALVEWWTNRLTALRVCGAAGFLARPIALWQVPAWRSLTRALREVEAWIGVDTLGHAASDIAQISEGFDAVLSSLAWWDGSSSWFYDEHARLAAGSTRVLAALDRAQAMASFEPWMPLAAAVVADGVVVTLAEVDPDRDALLGAANAAAITLPDGAAKKRTRPLLRTRREILAVETESAGQATLLVANLSRTQSVVIPTAALRRESGRAIPTTLQGVALAPGAALLVPLVPGKAISATAPQKLSVETLSSSRIAIESIAPALDGGRFAVKRCVGDRVDVSADIFADGHDRLAAHVLYRAFDEKAWKRAPMRALGNDRWAGAFDVDRQGRYEFIVEAWRDDFATLRDELDKKFRAGSLEPVDLADARILLDATRRRARAAASAIGKVLAAFDRSSDKAERVSVLLGPHAADAMAAAAQRPFLAQSATYTVQVERLGARYASWYELFPRSLGVDGKHGTFDDVVARLPAISAMGFDVLYMPPIHPIGHQHRKGPNNSLTPTPDDPGSPYAIGDASGGHDAVHAELGGIEGFRRLIAAAAAQGIEIALDFAIQASPDHPWLTQHPGWFTTRADGTIRHAENPPKKYEDIVNVDFFGDDAVPGLWNALRDVVLFWAGEGVRLFRVDNPHTKPLPFWEWLIAEVRRRHPDVLFLAEAFTRPKPMYRLAKLGFAQSYTYFTWRNDKHALASYLEELNMGEPRECFRPHFFVNTPDINPYFLQTGGRPAHLIRAALATTLSGLWGMYAGFELCDATPLPGREEYLDSEKYQLRARDWHGPGNIVAEITRLNALRRMNPELQTHLDVEFLNSDDGQVLYFAKGAKDGAGAVLVAINLDPYNDHATHIEVPLWRWGLADDASVEVEDLWTGQRFEWHGKLQFVHLDCARPFALWRVYAPFFSAPPVAPPPVSGDHA